MLSLIETAIRLTDGRVAGREIAELLDVAKSMLTSKVELFEGAREALEALSADYSLALITKGDLLHQRSKLERSGLGPHFRHVEVVSHKTPDVYRAILERQGVEPARFLMVGNSPRSDILPVLALGGSAAYVPAPLSWSHEHDEVPSGVDSNCVVLKSLLELPASGSRLADTTDVVVTERDFGLAAPTQQPHRVRPRAPRARVSIPVVA